MTNVNFKYKISKPQKHYNILHFNEYLTLKNTEKQPLTITLYLGLHSVFFKKTNYDM